MEPRMLLASGLAAGMLAIAAPSQAGTLHVGVVFTSGGYDHGRGHGRETYRIGYDRGQNEGFGEGVKDARRNQHYGFADEGAYRCGDRGYRREYGPKHRYVAGFREGFEEGYRRGYRLTVASRHRHSGHSGWCYDGHGRDHRYGRDGYDGRYDRDRYDRHDDRDRYGRRCDPRYDRCER